jgi:zinc/manganese transport system ATP-binding protein
MTNEAAQRVAAAQATQPDLLTLDDIGVRLGGRQVLSDVTFSLRKGEFTGIIGPNGAGKTTLLRVILGLLEPSGGRVLINGEPVDGKSKSAIGYVPQKLVIDPDMPLRARDVVGLGLDGHKLGFAFPSRQRRDQIEAALSDVGAARYADARVGELSGGEQQRVLIAHALISRPSSCCSTSRWPTSTSGASRRSSRCSAGWPASTRSPSCSPRTT